MPCLINTNILMLIAGNPVLVPHIDHISAPSDRVRRFKSCWTDLMCFDSVTMADIMNIIAVSLLNILRNAAKLS